MTDFYSGFVEVREGTAAVHGSYLHAADRSGDKEAMAAVTAALFEMKPGRLLHIELICHQGPRHRDTVPPASRP